ncbi:MAG: hypothetical protein LWY06_15235 [Firmicutes bacterium]|nr:hypothetical protein [Bacillota bacterium]
MNLTKTLSLVVMCIFLIGAIVGCNPQPAPQTPAAPPAAPPAGSPAAPAGSPAAAPADADLQAAATALYDNVSKGDVEKLTGEVIKKEIVEKIKTAKSPNEAGDIGSVVLVAGLVKEKRAEVAFKDIKVTVNKVDGDKAEVKVEAKGAFKMTVDGKEKTSEDTIEDTLTLEKVDGKWKVVDVKGKKSTNSEVKPEGDAPKAEGDAKVEGEAPKAEGEKADAPKTEGEAPKAEGEKAETK